MIRPYKKDFISSSIMAQIPKNKPRKLVRVSFSGKIYLDSTENINSTKNKPTTGNIAIKKIAV